MRITQHSVPMVALSLAFFTTPALLRAAEDPALDAAGPPPPAASPATTSTPTTAPAQGAASTTTAASSEQARVLFEEGVKYYNQENYEQAYSSFSEAYKLKPHPAVLLNVAQSALLARKFPESANHFAQYLAETANDPKQSPEAKTGFEEAKSKCLGIAITVDEPEAQISVDGVDVGKSPRKDPYFVAPGPHQITATKASKSAEAQVDGKAGEVVPANLAVASGAQAAAAVQGDFSSSGPEDDGGRKPFIQWFKETPVAWVGAGVTGLGLGGSLIFSLVSAGNYSSADDTKKKIFDGLEADGLSSGAAPCGPPALDQRPGFNGQTSYASLCSDYVDQRDSGDTFKTVSIVSLVIGVVAGGGTVAYYFLDPNAKESSDSAKTDAQRASRFQARLVPISTSTTQGLSLVGSF